MAARDPAHGFRNPICVDYPGGVSVRSAVFPLLLTLAACAGAPAVRSNAAAIAAAAPEWVQKGSRIEGRRILGVGSVAGIDNVPLARTTALDRGRAEISRILDTYSASLMKDYQASTSDGAGSDEAQRVEQAIKTFSANLLKGAEQKDMWLEPRSKTWFALVELDLDRAETMRSEGLGGGLDAWLAEHGDDTLSEMEAELERRRAPPIASAPPPSPIAPSPPAAPSGARPSWVDGQCEARLLCGSADGPDAAAADAKARGQLALRFEANIQTVAESFQSAAREVSGRTGESWEEIERVSDHSLVGSDKTLAASNIHARWLDPDRGRTWSLAVIERAPAARALGGRIRELDRAIDEALAKARAASGLDRLPFLRRALQSLGAREAANADLRVLSNGRGIPARVTWSDVLALLEDTARSLRVGLAVAGPGAEQLRDCLEVALSDAGHELQASEADVGAKRAPRLPDNLDARLEAVLRAQRRGRIAGGEVVRTQLSLRLVNGRSGRLVRTVSATEQATRPSWDAAVATAVTKMCAKAPSVVSDLQRGFGP